jgi:hypothetical protein
VSKKERRFAVLFCLGKMGEKKFLKRAVIGLIGIALYKA